MVNPSKRALKRHLTLIEIFISLSILLVIASFFTMKGLKLVNHYRMESRLSELAQEIELMRQLSLSMGIEIRLVIKPGSRFVERECKELDLKKLKLHQPVRLESIEPTTEVTILLTPSGFLEPVEITLVGLGEQGRLKVDAPIQIMHGQSR